MYAVRNRILPQEVILMRMYCGKWKGRKKLKRL